MDEGAQLQAIVNGLQVLADRLSLEGRLLDSAQAVAGVQTIRALWTRLHPPKPVEPEEPAKEPTRLESV